jgi:hypothetical protein
LRGSPVGVVQTVLARIEVVRAAQAVNSFRSSALDQLLIGQMLDYHRLSEVIRLLVAQFERA